MSFSRLLLGTSQATSVCALSAERSDDDHACIKADGLEYFRAMLNSKATRATYEEQLGIEDNLQKGKESGQLENADN